jgi:4-carboxymuconolactone decarboxylase
MARMKLMTAARMTESCGQLAEVAASARAHPRPLGRSATKAHWLAAAYGDYLRDGTSVPVRLLMIAVLVTARHWKAEYMWAAQGPRARESGLSEAIIESLRKGEKPKFDDAKDAAVYDLVTGLYKNQAISDATYDAAEKALGEVGLVELLNVAGFYTTLAMVIAATGVPTIEGAKPAFLN